MGFTALIRRFTGNKNFLFAHNNNTTRLFANNLFNPQQQPLITEDPDKKSLQNHQTNSNLNSFAFQNDQTTNLIMILQGFQMVANRSNVVLFAVGGIVWRGLGWKILAITGSMYGLCYLYERLMWTRKTQEKLFKKQYADYASSKLKLIVDLTSQNAACQVQQ